MTEIITKLTNVLDLNPRFTKLTTSRNGNEFLIQLTADRLPQDTECNWWMVARIIGDTVYILHAKQTLTLLTMAVENAESVHAPALVAALAYYL